MISLLHNYIGSHAALGVLLALVQLIGFSLVVWLWGNRSATIRELGWPVGLLLGLGLGLVLNFQVFFFSIVVAKVPVELGLELVLAVEITLLLFLSKKQKKPIEQSRPALSLPVPHLLAFSDLVSWVLLLAAFTAYAVQVSHDIPGVFWAWDAVVSWNRWATEWQDNTPPIYTVGYPQLVPTLLASIYTWLGSIKVEPVARCFLLVFPLGVSLIFWDGYRRWSKPAFIYGLTFWFLTLTYVIPGMSISGYVDVPVALFVTLTCYLLLLATSQKIHPQVALFSAAISAAAALITKQPGGVAWVIWLAFFIWPGWLRLKISNGNWRTVWAGLGLFFVLAAPWYLYVASLVWRETDVTNLGYLMSTIHGDHSFIERIFHAFHGPLSEGLQGLGPPAFVGVVAAFLMLMACRQAWGRRMILGLFLPYTLIWAIWFSYDIRNLILLMPAISLILGMGLNEVTDIMGRILHVRTLSFSGIQRTGLHFPKLCARNRWIVFAGLVATIAWVPLPLSDIEKLDSRLRLENQNPVLNRMLIDYSKSPGFDGKVFTSYSPMFMIGALNPYTLSLKLNPNAPSGLQDAIRNGRPWCEIQAISPNLVDVRYVLLHESLLKPLIDRGLSEGSLQLVFENGGIRFIRIHCPH